MEFELTPEEYDQLVGLIAGAVAWSAGPTELVSYAEQLMGSHEVVPEAIQDMALLDRDAPREQALDRFWLMLDSLGVPRRPVDRAVVQAMIDEEGIDAVLAIMSWEKLAVWQLEDWAKSDPSTPSAPDTSEESLYIPMLDWSNSQMRTWLETLVANATTEWHFGRIGAGPLEDFVSDDPHDVAWLEQQLVKSAGFRRALASAWIYSQVPSETLDRFEKLAGVPLRRR